MCNHLMVLGWAIVLMGAAGCANSSCFSRSRGSEEFAFSLTRDPSSRKDIYLTSGESGETAVDLWHVKGDRPVTFFLTGLPRGASATISPKVCSPNCSPVISVTTTTQTPTGRFPITVTGKGGRSVDAASFILGVNVEPPPFDFSLTSNPPDRVVTLAPGAAGSTGIEVWHIASSGEVSFSLTGLPEGASASFSPDRCAPTCSSRMMVLASPETPAGTFPLIVSVSGGEQTRSTTVVLVVEPPPQLPPAPEDALKQPPSKDLSGK